jgi:hypothetical protein
MALITTLVPIRAELIARVRESITPVPANEVMVTTGLPVITQILTCCAGRSPLGDSNSRHVIVWVGGLRMGKLNNIIQEGSEMMDHFLAAALGLVTLLF